MISKNIFLRALLAAILLFSSGALALERQSNADYRARREKLGKAADGGAVLLFAGSEAFAGDAVYTFQQEKNFYYLTGWPEPGAALLIVGARPVRPATGAQPEQPARPYAEMLFLPARNLVQERWTGPKLGPDSPGVKSATGFDDVRPLDALPHALAALPAPVRLYTETPRGFNVPTDNDTFRGLVRLDAFPNGVSPQDVWPLIGEVRRVKDRGEIELIRKATDASVAAHMAAIRAMKPGVTEREIAALMQYEFGKRGCERPAYSPIVGAGYNSTVLHYSEDSGTVRDGDLVVLDVGGEYSMYASDVTRTLPANGRFTARQREIYDIVLGAQQAAIDAFVAGKSTLARTSENSLDRVARDYINAHGKDLHGEPLGKYFIHGLGHFMGLHVHDPGDTTKPLGPGMVFTIEPGIYIPEEKLGVRIEDDFLVGDDGKLINLSGAIPRRAEDVERAMREGKR